jgi:DNA-binding transcriptional LysR family regulator
MLGGLFAGLFKLLAGEAGASIGRGISYAALIAAAVPVVTIALGHKDEIAVELTWGQLALFAGFAWAIVEVARRAQPSTRPPMMLAAIAAGLAFALMPDSAIAAPADLEQFRELLHLIAWLQASGLAALVWFVWFQWSLERRVYRLEINADLVQAKGE